MEATDLILIWRKASKSGNGGGNCVEAASHDGAVLVRDTKQHGRGQVHRFTVGEWRAFVASVKVGELGQACERPSSAVNRWRTLAHVAARPRRLQA